MTEKPLTSLVARSPEDLLAMVPIVIGFQPAESVVMLTFGARHTFHARIDLPQRADDVDEMVGALLAPARRHEVTRVVLVVYAVRPGPARRAWRALRRGFEGAGIEVLAALRADGARWYPMTGTDEPLRERGVAYDISGHPFAAQAVMDGRVTHGSRDELAALLVPDPARAARIAGLIPDARPPEPGWVDALVRRHVAAGSSPSDTDTATLLVALEAGELFDEAGRCLTPVEAQRHVDLWLDVLRRTPTPYVAPVAALLGLAAWLSGNGALAWCAVDRCAEVDPDQPLMTYLAVALGDALPPSAWDPGTELSA